MVQLEDLDSMFAMGGFPEVYHVVVNSNSALAGAIMQASDESTKESIIKQAFDLARLSQGLLKGKELSEFVKRNWELGKLGN